MVQGSCSLCHETSLQMSTTNRKLNSYELSSLTNFECSLRFHAHLWAVFEKNAQLCGQEKHTERFLVFNSRRSKRDLSAQKWLTCNFSKWYPYIIQQRGNSILGSLPFLWYKRNKYFKKRDKRLETVQRDIFIALQIDMMDLVRRMFNETGYTITGDEMVVGSNLEYFKNMSDIVKATSKR